MNGGAGRAEARREARASAGEGAEEALSQCAGSTVSTPIDTGMGVRVVRGARPLRRLVYVVAVMWFTPFCSDALLDAEPIILTERSVACKGDPSGHESAIAAAAGAANNGGATDPSVKLPCRRRLASFTS